VGLHSERSKQRDGNGDSAQGESEYPETFLVRHPHFPPLTNLPLSTQAR
jgi:hypothetical protein